ncbi:alpha/beta hydrolase family protein [Flavobacterium sp. FlaQc-50]
MTLEDYVNLRVAQVTNPWMAYFLRYNPEPVLEKVKCPVLALNGEKDLQVAPKENLEIIQKALAKGGNKKVTIKEIPNLNHLFQECQTGSPDEYSKIEQTLSPIAMNEVLQWIKVQTK